MGPRKRAKPNPKPTSELAEPNPTQKVRPEEESVTEAAHAVPVDPTGQASVGDLEGLRRSNDGTATVGTLNYKMLRSVRL